MKLYRRIMASVITLVLVFALSGPVLAAPKIEFSTNGAANNYGPGAELMLVGKVTDSDVVIAGAEVTVTVTAGTTQIHYAKLVTDWQGFFRTRISVPKNAAGNLSLDISAAGEMENWSMALESSGSVEVLGFVDCVGYREGGTPVTIPASTSHLGFLFDGNVNYYNNRLVQGDLGLESLGINQRNRDCFTLYKENANGTFSSIGCQVNLVESVVAGGDVQIDLGRINLLPGKTIPGGDNAGGRAMRDAIFVTPGESLQPDTTYKLVIDGRLSGNSSATLGNSETFLFKTASEKKSPGGGGGSAGTPATSGNTTTVEVSVAAEVKGEKATVTIQNDYLQTAIESALVEAEEQGTAAVIQIAVDLESDVVDGVKIVEVNLPKEVTKDLAETGVSLAITAAVAEIVLDADIIANIVGKDVVVSASIVDNETLSNEVREQIGNRPVYSFTITCDGKVISALGGTATVTLPYTLQPGEDPNNLVIHYIDANGNMVVVPNCVYEDGKVLFTTTHFSNFAIINNQVNFADVPAGAWYKPFVHFVAARNLFIGVGEDMFAPNSTMTRAMFATVISRIDGASLAKYRDSKFTDVNMDTWYGPSIAWGEANGIFAASGDLFYPNEPISREDMAVMLYNYAKASGKSLPEDVELTFDDADDVSREAVQAVATMNQWKVISGYGDNQYLPKNDATRAEVSTIFSNYINAHIQPNY